MYRITPIGVHPVHQKYIHKKLKTIYICAYNIRLEGFLLSLHKLNIGTHKFVYLTLNLDIQTLRQIFPDCVMGDNVIFGKKHYQNHINTRAQMHNNKTIKLSFTTFRRLSHHEVVRFSLLPIFFECLKWFNKLQTIQLEI